MEKIDNNKDFLQSEEWRKFQESVGRKTYAIAGEHFSASIIEHKLPIVGRYFYVPRGPIMCHPELVSGPNGSRIKSGMTRILELAEKEKVGWIRFDANSEEVLKIVGSNLLGHQMSKAPHDMQPREVFIIDIAKTEEELLAEMSSKTRYNVRLAEKKGVSLRITNLYESTNKNDIDEFLRLVKLTSRRQGITSHPENYYRKMFEVIPAENIKLYVAEYQGKIIAANIVIFYGDTATYLHGASDNNYRNVMAPYLLQWRAIQDAKKAGCGKYDFGGISTKYEFYESTNKWKGITKFKTGFSPSTKPTEFPGSYDIILNPFRYNLYRILQKIKSFL